MPLANKPNAQPLPPCLKGFPVGSDSRNAFQVCKTLESGEHWLLSHASLTHPRPKVSCWALPQLARAGCSALPSCFALQMEGGRFWPQKSLDATTIMGYWLGWPTCMCTVSSEPVRRPLSSTCSPANTRQFTIRRQRCPSPRLSQTRECLLNEPLSNSNIFLRNLS